MHKGVKRQRSTQSNPATDAPPPTRQGRIFIAYAHEDHIWRESLWKHLGFLRHHHQVGVFTDKQIKPGDHWNEEIHRALLAADIFVPLLSGHFASSSYCNLVH